MISRLLDQGLGSGFEQACRRDGNLTYMLIFYHDVVTGCGTRSSNQSMKKEDDYNKKNKTGDTLDELTPQSKKRKINDCTQGSASSQGRKRVPKFKYLDVDCEIEEQP